MAFTGVKKKDLSQLTWSEGQGSSERRVKVSAGHLVSVSMLMDRGGGAIKWLWSELTGELQQWRSAPAHTAVIFHLSERDADAAGSSSSSFSCAPPLASVSPFKTLAVVYTTPGLFTGRRRRRRGTKRRRACGVRRRGVGVGEPAPCVRQALSVFWKGKATDAGLSLLV